MLNKNNKQGFSLIEFLVVIGIVALLLTIVVTFVIRGRDRARDAKRMNDINQVGRFLTLGCHSPEAGDGEYDLGQLLSELKAKYPQYANSVPANIRDPKTGTDAVSNYRYVVADNGSRCILYANLENDDEEVTLPNLDTPTPGGGKGVLKALSEGWNGSDKYFQVRN